MRRKPRSVAGEGGRQEQTRGVGMLPVLGLCGGPVTATMGSAGEGHGGPIHRRCKSL